MTVVEVPQWRGSGSRTAERLREGARLLADMVEGARRVCVDVDDDSLVTTASRVRTALAEARDGLLITAGGDCGVELEPVAAARRRYGDRLVVVWFDAHGDLNTPDSSSSGAYHGMVLRALTGDGPEGLVPEVPLDPGRIVLAGVRDLDPPEAAFVAAKGIRRLEVVDAAPLVEAIATAAAGGSADGDAVVYVHIDFDVLDPEVFRSVGCPTPGGLHPERLLSLVEAIAERFDVVGVGLMEYEPARDEDRELLSGLVAGVVDACARR
ncbi:arginase family protein [Nonomuraea basaltis]|uniref:arginase family protein n=1 Tax=Nonomuraea basaltis TaxID=2495887 RepID=UPI001F0E051F|nr:arginase family protein [Nonomuraea basaltis]